MTNETPIYNLEDLSSKPRIGVMTLREYVKKGHLKAKKVSRAYYVTEPNLMDFFQYP